jgi:SAM-dependent methyltransferase
MLPALDDVLCRWRRYEAGAISRRIADFDAMFRGDTIDRYLSAGRSAVEVIALAMAAARKPSIGSVLDLPSGAGRVTRHLRVFLPEAELFVSDVDRRSARFAAESFGAQAIEAAADFSESLNRAFDLVFCGSLLTHLPERRCIEAFDWLCAALAPDGLLVLTLSGRRADYGERTVHRHIDPAKWQCMRESAYNRGLGFVETERIDGAVYGYTLTAPSWIMRIVERRPLLRIITYQEAAWNDHQDVIVVQRKALDLPFR